MLSSKSGSKSHSNQQQDDGFLITDFRSLKLQVFLLHHRFFVLIASRGKVISNKTAIKELEIKWINIFSLTDIILELISLLTDNYQENISPISANNASLKLSISSTCSKQRVNLLVFCVLSVSQQNLGTRGNNRTGPS